MKSQVMLLRQQRQTVKTLSLKKKGKAGVKENGSIVMLIDLCPIHVAVLRDRLMGAHCSNQIDRVQQQQWF